MSKKFIAAPSCYYTLMNEAAQIQITLAGRQGSIQSWKRDVQDTGKGFTLFFFAALLCQCSTSCGLATLPTNFLPKPLCVDGSKSCVIDSKTYQGQHWLRLECGFCVLAWDRLLHLSIIFCTLASRNVAMLCTGTDKSYPFFISFKCQNSELGWLISWVLCSAQPEFHHSMQHNCMG